MYLSDLMLGDAYYVEVEDSTKSNQRVYLGVLVKKRIIDPNSCSDSEYVFSQRIRLEDTEENHIICVVCDNDEDALEIVYTDIALPELEKPRALRQIRLDEPLQYYRLKEFFIAGRDALSEPTSVCEYVW